MRRKDLISALVLLAGAVGVGIEAWRLGLWSGPGIPGPGFLPLLLAIGLAVGAGGILVEAALAGADNAAGGGAGWFSDRAAITRLAVLLACIVALVAAVEPLGMLPAVGLFLLVFLSLYLRGRWPAILLISGLTPVCLHLIFERWLKFTLPRGFWGF